MNETISVKQTILTAWILFKTNWKVYYKIALIVFLVVILISLPVEVITDTMQKQLKNSASTLIPLFIIFAMRLASAIINNIISMGWIKVVLAIIRNTEPSLNLFKTNTKQIINFFIAGFIYGVIVIVGIILLIIPGIIWSYKYGFAPILVIDKNLGPFEALSASANITQGAKWQLYLLGLASFGIVLLGILALVVGLFVAIPVVGIAHYVAYNTLLPKLSKKV